MKKILMMEMSINDTTQFCRMSRVGEHFFIRWGLVISKFSSGTIAMNWLGAAMALSEHGFQAVVAYKDVWVLKAALDRAKENFA